MQKEPSKDNGALLHEAEDTRSIGQRCLQQHPIYSRLHTKRHRVTRVGF